MKKTTSKKATLDYSCFLKTIASSRKRELATAIFENAVDESVVEDFGTIRIQEMQRSIDLYNENPEKYIRGHQLSACKTC